MIEGTLILESLRVGTELPDLELVARKISRYRAGGTTAEQPAIWSVLDFEADEAVASDLAQLFAKALEDKPLAWYVNFQSPSDSFVVFPGRVFHYPCGDAAGRAEATEYGRELGIPESQLDWTV